MSDSESTPIIRDVQSSDVQSGGDNGSKGYKPKKKFVRPLNRRNLLASVEGRNNPRLAKFTEGIISGKSMYQASLDAGYSEAYAKNAYKYVMPAAREIFRTALERHAPIGKVTQRIAEGLDAMETKFFQKEGIVTDSRDVINWSERREAAKLAAFLLDVEPEKPVTLNGGSGMAVQVEINLQHFGLVVTEGKK